MRTYCIRNTYARVSEPKVVKNRVHLDLYVVDRAREVERLVALGGRVVREFDGWTVMADPEGNEFCVCESGAGSASG